MFHPRKILVPTDFSRDAEVALQFALSVAARYAARVFLLHVISNTLQQNLSDYCHDQNIVDRIMNESIVFSNEKLRETIAKWQTSREIKIIPDVRKGQPY